MKNETKRKIKLTVGILMMNIGIAGIAYTIGKSIGYDKGVFDVLSARLDNDRI